jgi:hypothetical protein
MDQKNLLLVCLDIRDFKKISEIDLSIFTNVIVASDNIKVHKECGKLKIYKSTFLQKPISHSKVSTDVVKMIDKVNDYLSTVSEIGIFNKKDLFWDYHVEGGYTTQRLQDILLAIECAYHIFSEHEINELIIIGNDDTIETAILKKLAIIKGFKISFYSQSFFINQNKIKDFFRPFYYLFKSLICKITSKKINLLNKRNIILFQMCNTIPSYVENILFPQDELTKNGFTPLNMVWGSTKEVKKIIDDGYKAVSIEYYLKYKDIFHSLYKTILVFIKFKTLKNKFYENSIFIYKGIGIEDLVFDSIYKYLYTDGPENYRYKIASKNFVNEYSKNFIAIKYCAAKFLTKGSILSQIIEDKYLKFEYSLGVNFEMEYTEYAVKKNHNFLNNNFIRFVSNEIDKKKLVDTLGFPDHSVIVFGSGRFNKHFNNVKNLNKADSKKKIGIKKDYEIYALLDLQAPVPGYMSAEEIIYLLNVLINIAREQPNLALIIKPYPSVVSSLLSEIRVNKTDNVYLVEKNSLPDDALNLADVIFSNRTMGVESMIYDVQVISMFPDKKTTFKIFGDSAEYIYDKNELNSLLKKIFYSKSNFVNWKNTYKKKREQFVQEYFPKIGKSSAKILADEITKNIRFNSCSKV